MESTIKNLIKALLQCHEKGCVTSVLWWLVVYLTQIHNIGLITEKKKSNKPKMKDILKIPGHWFLKVSKS